MSKFVLLKQTFPVSDFDRVCDGYKIITDALDEETRNKLSINELAKIIKAGEKYLYRVGKKNGQFKDVCISLHNFEIIRNNIKYFKNFIDEEDS
jgi:hypothetical protein